MNLYPRIPLVVALVAALAAPSHAASLTWNLAGSGAWDTTAANWTGGSGVFVDGVDTVTFGNPAGGTITIAANMSPVSTTVNAASGTYTFSGGPIDSGTLTKSNGGTLILTGANTYAGLTTVNAGILGVQDSGALGTTAAGTTLAASATLQLSNGVSVSGETLATGNASVLENLSGANSWSGTITNSSSSATIIRSTSGTLTVSGNLAGNTGAKNFTFDGAGTTLVTGQILGTVGILIKNGTGLVVLSGTNTYATASNPTSINDGALEAVDGVGLTATTVLQLRGGVLQSNGTFTRTLGTGANQFNWGAATTGGFSARTDALAVNLNGGAALTWAQASFVANGQELLFGSASADNMVNLQNALSLGTAGTNTRGIRVNDNAGSTADFARLSGVVSGSSGNSLQKEGAGVLELTNTNTYLGTTTVNAGTLLINGNQSAATGAVSVAANATLGGGGTIGGATTIADSGILAPGNSPGVLTFASSLTLAGADTEVNFELASGVRGTDYDGVNVGGALAYNGDFTLSIAASIADGTYNLFDFGSQTGGFESILFGGVGPYSGFFSDQGLGVWTATSAGQNFTFNHSTGDLLVAAVPEPSTYALLLGGLGALFLIRRRSRILAK